MTIRQPARLASWQVGRVALRNHLVQSRYANAFSNSGGPGYLFVNRGPARLGLQFVVSGEDNGRDHFRGETEGDKGSNVVYCGPRLVIAHSERLTAEITGDLPVTIHNTSFQTVPSYRMRAGFVVRF